MSLVVSCAVLAVIISPVSIVLSAIGSRGFSGESILMSAIAGSVCWLAAALALTATLLGNRFQAPVQGMLLGMFFRMGLPLAAVVGLPQLGGDFAAGGLTVTILGVYLAALLIETLLAVRMISPLSGATTTSGAKSLSGVKAKPA